MKIKKLVSLCLVLLLSLTIVEVVNAYILNGWYWTTTSIKYKRMQTDHASDINGAANSWNASTSHISLAEVSGNYYEHIAVMNGNYGAMSWYGRADEVGNYPIFSHVNIRLNRDTLTTNHLWQYTPAHEFGHALGLDHDDSWWWWPGYCRLMVTTYPERPKNKRG